MRFKRYLRFFKLSFLEGKNQMLSIIFPFQNYWSPSVCMEFCSNFLKYIANEMNGIDSPYDVFRFDFDPTNSESIFLRTYKKPNDFRFLPEWYIKEVEAFGAEQI